MEAPQRSSVPQVPGFQPVTMQDVRNRLIYLIVATPRLDWVLRTDHPDNVERMLPPLERALINLSFITSFNLWDDDDVDDTDDSLPS